MKGFIFSKKKSFIGKTIFILRFKYEFFNIETKIRFTERQGQKTKEIC